MKQKLLYRWFLAHSIHGRLRRIHIPHQAVYTAFWALGDPGLFFPLFGFVSSYVRMALKVSSYNALEETGG